MTPFVQHVTDFLSYLTVLGDLFVVFLAVVLATPLKKHGWGRQVKNFVGAYSLFLAFLVGLVSVLGSLFYSQVAGFEPCFLCWIQRGFLYTEAVIFFFAIIARGAERVRKYDHVVRKAAIILSGIGGLVSVYNIYLQLGGSGSINCAAFGTVNCELVYFTDYGYVTIPVMALTAFAMIIVFMLCGKKKGEEILAN
jgi:disulfide bond formation protein DsbB